MPGAQSCPGHAAGRYEALFKGIPTLRLAAGLDEIDFTHDGKLFGVYQLSVSW
jgi:hypothetical protein